MDADEAIVDRMLADYERWDAALTPAERVAHDAKVAGWVAAYWVRVARCGRQTEWPITDDVPAAEAEELWHG